jgi:iron complex transport system substrate-binding protein
VSRLTVFAAAVAAALVLVAGGPAAAKPPQRIISLSATATSSLFAIGAGKQVVAVDGQSDWPKNAPRTSLSGYTPNVEAIAGYKPDLVVIAYDPNGLSQSLQNLGIKVLRQDAAKTLDDAYGQIVQLGQVTGHSRQAKTLVTTMKAQIAKIVAKRARSAQGLTVYHELEPDLYSATSKSFIGQIYSLFGLRNIADAADTTGSGYPKLSPEYIVQQNPDIIVLADIRCCGASLRTVAARPGWSNIRAVRTGTVVRVDDSVASQWGPRIVDFVRAVGAALKHLRAPQ